MAITRLSEDDILDADLVTEDEHMAIGDAAPHHPQSHSLHSPDHLDISGTPETGDSFQWNGTAWVFVAAGAGAPHTLTGNTHSDTAENSPIENGDVLKYNATYGIWVNSGVDDEPLIPGRVVDDNDDAYVDDNGDFYVMEA